MYFQSKIDNLGMYHAIAKDLDEYNGRTDLMKDIGMFVQRKPKKYTVICYHISIFRQKYFQSSLGACT